MRITDWIDPQLYKEVVEDLKKGKVISAVNKYVKTIPMTVAAQKTLPFVVGNIAKAVGTAYPGAAPKAASIAQGLSMGIKSAGDLWLAPSGALAKGAKVGATNVAKSAAASATLKKTAIAGGKFVAAGAIAYGADRAHATIWGTVPSTHAMWALATGKASAKDKERIRNAKCNFKGIISGSCQTAALVKLFRPSFRKGRG